MKDFLLWTIWNLLLATLPVVFGHAARRAAQKANSPAARVATAVLLALWLAFLPNSCYLFTEWRHFLSFVDGQDLYVAARSEPALLFDIALRALFYFCYAAFGALALTLAIRPIEQLMRERGLRCTAIAPMLFGLLSLGVYLGLILRFNSWDLWTRPGVVWAAIADVPSAPRLSTAIIIFALLLWAIYEAMDIWVEGVQARLASRLPARRSLSPTAL